MNLLVKKHYEESMKIIIDALRLYSIKYFRINEYIFLLFDKKLGCIILFI